MQFLHHELDLDPMQANAHASRRIGALAIKNPCSQRPQGRSLNRAEESGGTNSGVSTVEEQAHHKQHGHATSSGDKPEGESSFGPAGTPGNSWTAIGKTIGNTTVGKIGFLAA